ncbi:hypothetical protein K439DRAFT_1612178 [Ramaria rubella]|nr:hypothetical protein K439DRAFT_1612178 [Ramaria rubella]
MASHLLLHLLLHLLPHILFPHRLFHSPTQPPVAPAHPPPPVPLPVPAHQPHLAATVNTQPANLAAPFLCKGPRLSVGASHATFDTVQSAAQDSSRPLTTRTFFGSNAAFTTPPT